VIYYVDATVALYAASRAPRYKTPAVEILRAVASGTVDAVTSAAVIEDIMYRFASLNRRMRVWTSPTSSCASSHDLRADRLGSHPRLHSPPRRAPATVPGGPSWRHHAEPRHHGSRHHETAFELLSGCTRVDISEWPPGG